MRWAKLSGEYPWTCQVSLHSEFMPYRNIRWRKIKLVHRLSIVSIEVKYNSTTVEVGNLVCVRGKLDLTYLLKLMIIFSTMGFPVVMSLILSIFDLKILKETKVKFGLGEIRIWYKIYKKQDAIQCITFYEKGETRWEKNCSKMHMKLNSNSSTWRLCLILECANTRRLVT